MVGWLLKKMKICELCKSFARIYCESDQASLCWTCDAKVHSANFLVARHSRRLLCHSCQSPTQWSASGEKLESSTVSICEKCVVEGISDDDDDDGTGTDDDEEYYGDEDDEDEVDSDDREVIDDNQVLPWSSTTPPPAASSSSNEEFSIAGRSVSITKRHHQNVPDLSSEDEINCSSVQKSYRTRTSTVAETAVGGDEAAQIHSSPSRSEAIMEKLNRNRKRNMISEQNESATVVGKSKARRAVGFDLNS